MNSYTQKELLLEIFNTVTNENTSCSLESITHIQDRLPMTYKVYSKELHRLSNNFDIHPNIFKVLVLAMSIEAGTVNMFIMNEIIIELFGLHMPFNELYVTRTNRLLEYIHESRPDIESDDTIDLTKVASLTKDSPYSKDLNNLLQTLSNKPQLSFTLDNIKRNRLISVIGSSLPDSETVGVVDLVDFINNSLILRLDITLGSLNPYKGIMDIIQTSNTSQLQSIITMIDGLVLTACE